MERSIPAFLDPTNLPRVHVLYREDSVLTKDGHNAAPINLC